MTAPKPTPPPAAARAKILARYARIGTHGKPEMCGRFGVPGVELKVIFPNQAAAEDAEAELVLLPGAFPQRAYPCERSKHGHFHLTSDVDRKGAPANERHL